jgi:hypothetical protein
MRVLILAGLLILPLSSPGQDEEFRVYTEHPRLILTAQRLRLLKRERDRQTPRWRQFELLMKGSAKLPEPGFASALYYAISGDAAIGKRAVDWALGPASGSPGDLRQLALVYDWCQPVLSLKDSAALAGKIRGVIARQTGSGISAERDKILGWIATAPDGLVGAEHSEEAALQQAVRQWWRMSYAPSLADGRIALPLPDMYALLEILHAIRDNLKIDLRDAATSYFAYLPKYLVIGNYPAAYRAPENEFRIPMDSVSTAEMYSANAQPDLARAALARAAGFAMVDYDTNGLANQFLQGWLIHDRFSMMTPFGAAYEFLWANPYQPGLSYFQLPLVFHDENTGALFVRSTWDEDADWVGLYGGKAELFLEGRATLLGKTAAGNPLHMGESTVIFGRTPLQFSMEGGTVLAIGLKPRHPYLVETDDEEMSETVTDQAGTLVLQYPSSRKAGVRIHEENEGSHGKSGA